MTWNAVCDRCGFDYRNTQLRKEWTGLMVCTGAGTNNCFEVRHPQDHVRAVRDKQTPPWVRPDNDIAMSTVTDDLGNPVTDFQGFFVEDSESTPGATFLSPGDVTADDL